MDNLAKQSCVPCESGGHPLSLHEIEKHLSALKDWHRTTVEGNIFAITKEYETQDFVEAMDLAQDIAELAEEEGHHPRLTVEYGSLVVTWWTHAVEGLHENDFIMAAKSDELAAIFHEVS